MDGGKVGVSICEGWVDLDGTSVALEGALNVLHLLQCVAHITVNTNNHSVKQRRPRLIDASALSF